MLCNVSSRDIWIDESEDISLFHLQGYISQGKTCTSKGGLIMYIDDQYKNNTVKLHYFSIYRYVKIYTVNVDAMKSVMNEIIR